MKKNIKTIKGLRNSIDKVKENMFIDICNYKVNRKNKYMIKLPCLVDYNKDSN